MWQTFLSNRKSTTGFMSFCTSSGRACMQPRQKAYIAMALALLLRLVVTLPQPTFAFLESRNSELGLVAMSRMRLTSAMFKMPICFR